jgi:hypothetical protein
MSLMNQNNPKKGKKGNQQKSNQNNSKFIPKSSSSNKNTGFAQRPHKAGGTRGS